MDIRTLIKEETEMVLMEKELTELLNELNELNEDQLNEGFWEKTKFYIAKLGRVTKGGKFIGRTKQSLAAAEQIGKLLGDQTNKLIIALDKNLKQKFPEFPNIESKDSFTEGIAAIETVYNSIIAENKKKKIDSVSANKLIANLRIYTKKLADYDLAQVYQYMTEEESEDKNTPLLEKAPTQISGKEGEGTETMKVNKSNKLPMVLGIIGGGLGGFSFLTHTEWFKDLIGGIFGKGGDAVSALKDVSSAKETFNAPVSQFVDANVKPGEGLYKFFQRVFPDAGITETAPKEKMAELISKFGNGDLQKGADSMKGMFIKPDTGVSELVNRLQDPNLKTLNDVFPSGTQYDGTGKSVFGILAGGGLKTQLMTAVSAAAGKAAIKAGAAGIVTGGGGAVAATVLGVIGLTAVSAAIALKLLRSHGQKKSRLKELEDLVLRMKDIAQTKEEKAVDDEIPEKGKNNKMVKPKDVKKTTSLIGKSFQKKGKDGGMDTVTVISTPEDGDDKMGVSYVYANGKKWTNTPKDVNAWLKSKGFDITKPMTKKPSVTKKKNTRAANVVTKPSSTAFNTYLKKSKIQLDPKTQQRITKWLQTKGALTESTFDYTKMKIEIVKELYNNKIRIPNNLDSKTLLERLSLLEQLRETINKSILLEIQNKNLNELSFQDIKKYIKMTVAGIVITLALGGIPKKVMAQQQVVSSDSKTNISQSIKKELNIPVSNDIIGTYIKGDTLYVVGKGVGRTDDDALQNSKAWTLIELKKYLNTNIKPDSGQGLTDKKINVDMMATFGYSERRPTVGEGNDYIEYSVLQIPLSDIK